MPWYKDPLWWRDHWLEALFGLVGMGAGAYALALLGQIGKIATAYPKALAAFGLLSFSTGALLGSSRRRHEREMERLRREEDRKDRMEAERREEERRNAIREAQARAWVMELSPSQKMLLLRLSRGGYVATNYMDQHSFRDWIAPVSAGIEGTRVNEDWMRNYVYRLSLNDFGELAARVGMDLLEEVERIREEPEEVAE